MCEELHTTLLFLHHTDNHRFMFSYDVNTKDLFFISVCLDLKVWLGQSLSSLPNCDENSNARRCLCMRCDDILGGLCCSFLHLINVVCIYSSQTTVVASVDVKCLNCGTDYSQDKKDALCCKTATIKASRL